MPSAARNSLSRRLLGIAVPLLCLLVLLSSSVQLAHDLRIARQALRADGERLLEMFRDSAGSALERRDIGVAGQLLTGLLAHPGVRQASLHDAEARRWAEQARPAAAEHWSVPLLFGPVQHFAVALYGPAPQHTHYGRLAFSLGAEAQASAFLARAQGILAGNLVLALLLGLGLWWLLRQQLSRPLASLVEQLTNIRSERPGAARLDVPAGHQHDELGCWVTGTNQLLGVIARSDSRQRETQDDLLRLSRFDPLTGLPNRLQLQQQLELILADAERSQSRVAVLCLGLDEFQLLNEQYGYQTGDRLLTAVSERLRSLDGRIACLARLGGDQFALVHNTLRHSYEAADLAEQVLSALGQPVQLERQHIQLHATLGITRYPEDGDSAERLLQRAEQTMALAKQKARNRYRFYIASLDREIRERRQLEHDLQHAVQHGQLELYYQPQVAGPEQCVVAVEALLRWRHPQLGFISPEQFIPLAEQNGLILPIGDWVLEQACRQLHDWHRQGLKDLRMAVNLSTAQLRSEKLPRLVLGLLQRYQLPPYSLELEVTETGLMSDVGSATRQLHSLRLARVLLAIDDFGTGYSSLSYLKSLPLDRLKIDRSFVRDLTSCEDDATIVRTIIQLAHSLNMTVIAEGVETREQEAYLSAHGCHETQGYLYSRPLPALEASQYLLNAARRRPHGQASPLLTAQLG